LATSVVCEPMFHVMSVQAGVFCIIFTAIQAKRVVSPSNYDQYAGAGCFINQGGKPVDPQGDPVTVGFFTKDQCAEQCELVPGCNAYTRGAAGHLPSLCWLRKNVDLGRCLKNTPYETWAKREVVEDDILNCQDHTQLTCQRDVEWFHDEGKKEKWSEYAYQFMTIIAGVDIKQASKQDFQRLSYCNQILSRTGTPSIQHDPCVKPPCHCSKPPCDVCSTVGNPKILTTTTTTTTTIPKTCANIFDPESATCRQHVEWAHGEGKFTHSYPKMQGIAGVSVATATLEDFQRLWFCSKKDVRCSLPPCGCSSPPCDSCKERKNALPTPPGVVVPAAQRPGKANKVVGWVAEGKVAGNWGWCKQQPPVPHWSATAGCPSTKDLDVTVLSYNLFWWFLFGVRKGADRMAGKLVAKTAPWDMMGFQECDDVKRIVSDSGMLQTHDFYRGTHAVSNAWAKVAWHPIKHGHTEVAEDHRSQWYGRRAVVWSRLQHKKTGKVVFFMNFHGPLPVGGDGGGFCGAEASAYNMLKVIGENARQGDCIILVGDFNAVRNSKFLNSLGKYLTHQYQGNSFGGVDNFYTNGCVQLVSSRNLGNGGSDHDALGATFRI